MLYRTTLSIAGLPFEIVTNHRLVSRFVESYFTVFRSRGTPRFSIEIDSDVPAPVKALRNRVNPKIEHDDRGGYLIVNNTEDNVEIGHIEENHTLCRLSGRTCADTFLLSSAIGICVQFELEQSGGFLLQAACGSVGGRGVLFTGKSVTGKTAALHNLHPDSIIAEDMVALRSDEQGIRAYAVPFRGEAPVEAELNALCFPRKSTGIPALHRESAESVAAALTANTLFCAPESDRIRGGTLSTITHCSTVIPGYDCVFDSTTDLHAVFSSKGILN